MKGGLIAFALCLGSLSAQAGTKQTVAGKIAAAGRRAEPLLKGVSARNVQYTPGGGRFYLVEATTPGRQKVIVAGSFSEQNGSVKLREFETTPGWWYGR